MVDYIVLLVILFLAAPVLAIIALVNASGINDGLRRLEQAHCGAGEQAGAATAAPPRTSPEPEKAPPRAGSACSPAPNYRRDAAAGCGAIAFTACLRRHPFTAAAARCRLGAKFTRPELDTAAGAAPARDIGFEERFGTRWVVWVGGVALALGGIFLVRYTIEQGLIGPRVRIVLGALAGAGAGRRRRMAAAQRTEFWRCPVCRRQIFRPF